MKVLDATSLIDYSAGVDAAAEFLVADKRERFVLPAPAYADALVGGRNTPDGGVEEPKPISRGEVYETDKEPAELAGRMPTRSVPEDRSSPGWTDSVEESLPVRIVPVQWWPTPTYQ